MNLVGPSIKFKEMLVIIFEQLKIWFNVLANQSSLRELEGLGPAKKGKRTVSHC